MNKDMKKENLCNCSNCTMGCSPSLQERGLCPLNSTSIICNRELLKSSANLELICSNEENEYYHIKDFNSTIMHVEEGFCIHVDYMVPMFSEDRHVCVPKELCKYKYTMQRIHGRDCVVRNKNRRISYDIMEIIGRGKEIDDMKRNGMTIDYRFETHDERLLNFISRRECDKLNLNDKRHNVSIEITSIDSLNDFIDDTKPRTRYKVLIGIWKNKLILIRK